jgi:hypothetical protein
MRNQSLAAGRQRFRRTDGVRKRLHAFISISDGFSPKSRRVIISEQHALSLASRSLGFRYGVAFKRYRLNCRKNPLFFSLFFLSLFWSLRAAAQKKRESAAAGDYSAVFANEGNVKRHCSGARKRI